MAIASPTGKSTFLSTITTEARSILATATAVRGLDEPAVSHERLRSANADGTGFADLGGERAIPRRAASDRHGESEWTADIEAREKVKRLAQAEAVMERERIAARRAACSAARSSVDAASTAGRISDRVEMTKHANAISEIMDKQHGVRGMLLESRMDPMATAADMQAAAIAMMSHDEPKTQCAGAAVVVVLDDANAARRAIARHATSFAEYVNMVRDDRKTAIGR